MVVAVTEIAPPRLLGLVKKIQIPSVALELSLPEHGGTGNKALSNLPGQSYSGGNRDRGLASALQRILNLRDNTYSDEVLVNALVRQSGLKTTAGADLKLESERDPFDLNAEERLIVPIVGCLKGLYLLMREPQLTGQIVADPIIALKHIDGAYGPAKVDRKPNLTHAPAPNEAGSSALAMSDLEAEIKGTLDAAAGRLYGLSKGGIGRRPDNLTLNDPPENALEVSCAALKEYRASPDDIHRFVESSQTSVRPFLSYLIAELHAASGDNRSAAFELERWLQKTNASGAVGTQLLRAPQFAVDGVRPDFLTRVGDAYRLAWRRMSMRLRMNQYLNELSEGQLARPDLRVIESEKLLETVYALLGESTLKKIDQGRNCGVLDPVYLRILMVYAQASNNYAYYASLLDVDDYKEHRARAERQAEFIKNMDRSCIPGTDLDDIEYFERHHVNTWAMVQLAGLRADAAVVSGGGPNIAERVRSILVEVEHARDQSAQRLNEVGRPPAEVPLWERWYPSEGEELRNSLATLSKHLRLILRELGETE